MLELIKILGLAADFADKFDPFVREKYMEYWRFVADEPEGESPHD